VAISSSAETIAPGPQSTPAFTYSVCSNCPYKRYCSQPSATHPRVTFAHLPWCFECKHNARSQRHLILQNEITKRTFDIDLDMTPLWVLQSKIDALDEIALEKGLVRSLLTVGLKKEELRHPSRDTHRFMQRIKRRVEKRYGPGTFQFVWVMEWQPHRLLVYGDDAQHYHCLIAAPPGCMPDYKYVQIAAKRNHYQCVREGDLITEAWIHDTWARGLILCKRCTGDMKTYMGKYMTKNLNDESCPRHSVHMRLFASSQPVTKLALPRWAKAFKEQWERTGDLDHPSRDYKFSKHILHLTENKISIRQKRTPNHIAPTAKEMQEALGKELQPEVRLHDHAASPPWKLGPDLKPPPSMDGSGDPDRWRQLWTLQQAVLLPSSVKPHILRGNAVIGHEETPLFGLKRLGRQRARRNSQPGHQDERGMRTYRGITYRKEGYGVDGADGQTDAYGKPCQASYLDTS